MKTTKKSSFYSSQNFKRKDEMIDLFRLTDGQDLINSMKEGDVFGLQCRDYCFEEHCRGRVKLRPVSDEVDTALTIIAHFKKEDGQYFAKLQSGSCELTGVYTDCFWGDIALESWQPALAYLQKTHPDFDQVVMILNNDPNLLDSHHEKTVDAICAFGEQCGRLAEDFFEIQYPQLWDSFDESFEEAYPDEVKRWANEDLAKAVADQAYDAVLTELNKKDGI